MDLLGSVVEQVHKVIVDYQVWLKHVQVAE